MSYKIILLHAGGLLATDFSAQAQELGWRLQSIDCSQSAMPDLDKEHISVIYDLVDSPLAEPSVYDRLMSEVYSLAAERQVPLVQLSSYKLAQEPVEGDFDESYLANAFVGSYWSERESRALDLKRYVCLRASWILNDGQAALFSSLVSRIIASDPSLCVSDHRYGGPISTAFIASVLVSLQQQIVCGAENWGLFHLHSADVCSEAEFCDQLVRQLSKELDREFDLPAVAGADDMRALYQADANVLGRRITDCFGIQLPTWRRGFGSLLRAWLHENGYAKTIEG
ncbi:sugar nucleotide-binding protein [Agaribacterium sp. ZY112]|uniref:sugar nucleotide-binding protein n=1 Tax=Agaribacterium sp. ZY112 TaxID=3233574 RepID=UPI0035234815